MADKLNVLVVIDMQKGLMTRDNRFLARDIRGHIETTKYDHIIFTKLVNKEGSNFVKRLGYDGMMEGNWLEIVDELKDIAAQYPVITKETYSCIKCTDLMAELLMTQRDVKLYLCGADVDACVLATAFECFDAGMDFEIIPELVGRSDGEMVRYTDKIIRRNIGYK